MALTRDEILAARDLATISVDVPEWGGVVHLRPLTGRERDKFETETLAKGEGNETVDVRARLVVAMACDEDGVLLFSPEDVDAVAAKSGRALDRLFPRAAKLSGMSKSDIADLAKN